MSSESFVESTSRDKRQSIALLFSVNPRNFFPGRLVEVVLSKGGDLYDRRAIAQWRIVNAIVVSSSDTAVTVRVDSIGNFIAHILSEGG